MHVDILAERKKKILLDKVFGMKLDAMLYWVRKIRSDMERARFKEQLEKERLAR